MDDSSLRVTVALDELLLGDPRFAVFEESAEFFVVRQIIWHSPFKQRTQKDLGGGQNRVPVIDEYVVAVLTALLFQPLQEVHELTAALLGVSLYVDVRGGEVGLDALREVEPIVGVLVEQECDR